MKLRALTSFSGAFTMAIGEVATCSNEEVAMDLIKAGYAEEVKETKETKKTEITEETKVETEAPAKKTTKRVKKNEDQ